MKTPNSDVFLLMALIKNQKHLTLEDGTDRFSRDVSKNIQFTRQQMHILLNLEKFKIYIKIHINIAPTCFGLRPSSGSLYWAWLKLY
jgi:hypothetical protein